jgi:hypothetical protein
MKATKKKPKYQKPKALILGSRATDKDGKPKFKGICNWGMGGDPPKCTDGYSV